MLQFVYSEYCKRRKKYLSPLCHYIHFSGEETIISAFYFWSVLSKYLHSKNTFKFKEVLGSFTFALISASFSGRISPI